MKKLLFLLIVLPFLVNAQEIISEEIDLKNGAIQIPGTLSYPQTNKKLPLVIFVHGSGNIDRNGNQTGLPIKANYIKTLADSLNAKGLAFYRYDKRTSVNANLAQLKEIILSDFVADVKIAITNFSSDKRFSSIHLIGHSQGSLVAMLGLTDEIDAFISIAGPSEAIDKVMVAQLKKQSEEYAQIAQNHFKELKETDTIQNINPLLASIFNPQNQKFFKSWMRWNPSDEIKKITIPVFILQGDADLQVTVADAKKLHNANPKSMIRVIPKMNHVLKEVNSLEENQKAYMEEAIPLSSKLVSDIIKFIK